MKKANSSDPAKYLPELKRIKYNGATGHIEFDERGDRRDAEITIFTMKDGKIEPIAVVKAGQTLGYEQFLKSMATGAAGEDSETAK
jgi:branched-chain amino acid transport system substrate-binding protein